MNLTIKNELLLLENLLMAIKCRQMEELADYLAPDLHYKSPIGETTTIQEFIAFQEKWNSNFTIENQLIYYCEDNKKVCLDLTYVLYKADVKEKLQLDILMLATVKNGLVSKIEVSFVDDTNYENVNAIRNQMMS